jgi:hypothetical protein
MIVPYHAPLLITESKEHYEKIRDWCMEEIKPREIVEQFFVEDIIYISWDILRIHRSRTALINLTFRAALEKTLVELLRQPKMQMLSDSPARELAYAWFSDEKAKSKVVKLLEQFHLDETAIEAEAMRSCAADLELFDKLLVSAESRRNRALRSVAEYRTDLALRLRATRDRIIDGEVLAVDRYEHNAVIRREKAMRAIYATHDFSV